MFSSSTILLLFLHLTIGVHVPFRHQQLLSTTTQSNAAGFGRVAIVNPASSHPLTGVFMAHFTVKVLMVVVLMTLLLLDKM